MINLREDVPKSSTKVLPAKQIVVENRENAFVVMKTKFNIAEAGHFFFKHFCGCHFHFLLDNFL
jgi:hypothetical protein